MIEAVVNTGLPGQGNLLILGVDMTGDRGLRQYDLESGDEGVIDDPLVFLAQAGFAHRHQDLRAIRTSWAFRQGSNEHHGRPEAVSLCVAS